MLRAARLTPELASYAKKFAFRRLPGRAITEETDRDHPEVVEFIKTTHHLEVDQCFYQAVYYDFNARTLTVAGLSRQGCSQASLLMDEKSWSSFWERLVEDVFQPVSASVTDVIHWLKLTGEFLDQSGLTQWIQCPGRLLTYRNGLFLIKISGCDPEILSRSDAEDLIRASKRGGSVIRLSNKIPISAHLIE